MLKYHPVIRPTVSSDFFEQTVDLWLGFDSGHMGPQMYQDHQGKRGNQSMSGVLTWEKHAEYGTLPRQNRASFSNLIGKVAGEVGEKLPVIEFGPGSMDDAKTLINVFGCNQYIPVDCSLGIILQAELLARNIPCLVSPSVINFFSKQNCPLIDREALGVLLGLTIDNVPGPVPKSLPKTALTEAFRNLAKAMPAGGFLLASTDVSQDGEHNTRMYNEPWHKLFGVNHVYRMASELPMTNFDPDGFEYLPVWHPHCSLLAHTVMATKDQEFQMGAQSEIEISVKKGDIFHYNNSFRYPPEFFEDCAEDAGLDVIKSWSDTSTIRFYLFHVPPRDARNTYKAPAAFATTSNRLARVQSRLEARASIRD